MLRLLIFTLVVALASGLALEKRDRRRLVVIDTDAGADDAMAIMMAVSSVRAINVIGITCVHGNTGVNNVSINVLKTLKVADRLKIPVYVGSSDSLVYTAKSDGFWGDDGLGDFDFPDPPSPHLLMKKPGPQALVDFVKKYPKRITVLAIGPLTNIAMAIRLYPQFLSEVKQILVLGGSYQGGGNVKPGVEFNIYADPEAAGYVLGKATVNYPIISLPLETVENAAATMDFRLNVLGKLPGPKMEFLNNAERKGLDKSKKEHQWDAFDQTAAAIIINPSIVKKVEKLNVEVETSGRYSRGAWVVDHRTTAEKGPIAVITDIDKEAVWKLMLETLK